MQQKAQIILAVAIAGTIAIAAWYFLSASADAPAMSFGATSTGAELTAAGDENNESAPETLRSQVPDGKTEYVHPSPVFSVLHPGTYTTTRFAERGGETVLFEKKNLDTSIQLHITPYDEPTSAFTLERIKQDVGEMDIRKPQRVSAGQTGRGITFLSSEVLSTETREVWFVRDGWLYQFSAPVDQQEVVYDILSSIAFKTTP